MLDSVSAELLKLRRHKATWFLVWIYPVGFTAGMLIMIMIMIAVAGHSPARPQSLTQWMSGTTLPWHMPDDLFGRYLIAAFVAVVFAGEYGWNTWKLIIPHRSRTQLIAAKYCIAAMLLIVAFVLSALISIAGYWASYALTGRTLPTGITLAALLRVHGTAALAVLAPVLVTIGYTSPAAVLTRSTIAALVIALVAITIEQLVAGLGPLLSSELPTVASILYQALPGYHIGNLASWIQSGEPLRSQFPNGTVVALAWSVSLATIVAWLVLLIGGTFVAFNRQDIN